MQLKKNYIDYSDMEIIMETLDRNDLKRYRELKPEYKHGKVSQ